MADHRSILLWLGSSFTTVIGLITVNDLAIMVGIAAGIGSLISSGVNIYFKFKNKGKKDIQ